MRTGKHLTESRSRLEEKQIETLTRNVEITHKKVVERIKKMMKVKNRKYKHGRRDKRILDVRVLTRGIGGAFYWEWRGRAFTYKREERV